MHTNCVESMDKNLQEAIHKLLQAIYDGEPCSAIGSDDDILLDKNRLLLHSSGTTSGSSKKIIYDSRRFLSGMRVVSETLGLSAERRAVSFVNPRYVYGLSVAASHAIAQEPVIFADNGEFVTEHEFLDIYMTPAQVMPFCLKNIRFPSSAEIRFIFAGDKLTHAVAKRLATQYPHALLTNMYGQVELGPRVSVNHTTSEAFIEGDAGTPIRGVDIEISEKNADGYGILKVRSDYQMLGYYTGKNFKPISTADWIETGDIAKINPEGKLIISGRSGKHVNLMGHRMNIIDFEQIASEIAGVAACRARVVEAAAAQRICLTIQPLDPNGGGCAAAVEAEFQKQLGPLASLIDVVIQKSTISEGAGKL